MSGTAMLWLAGAVPVFLAAAALSRSFVDSGSPAVLVLSLLLYTAGNLMMVRLMRESGLGVAISASAVAQIVLVNVIAFTVFGERPQLPQIVGMGLGMIGFALMVLPATPR